MKKLIKVLFMLLLIAPVYSQDELSLATIEAHYYNEMFEITSAFKLQINGGINEGETYAIIYFEPTLIQYMAVFSKEQRVEILAALQKYKEWRKIALKNQVEHTKDIVTFSISAVGDLNFLKTTVDNPNLTIRFASVDPKNHFLYFVFHEATTDNEFLKMTPDAFFLDYDNVILLEQVLQEKDFVTKTSEGLENLRKNDALFQ